MTSDSAPLPRWGLLERELWPALRSMWHPVAFSTDVAPGPHPVRLLGEELVLIRFGADLVCFRDLCIHRGTPLSLGWLEGRHIVCAYHGWEYDESGRCVRIPALPPDRSIPAKAQVERFAVREAHGLAWVCLGVPSAEIPDFPERADPGFTTDAAPSMVRTCSAARQIENFIDESHFAWVHEGILGDRLHAVAPAFDVTRSAMALEFGWHERPNAVHPPGHRRDYTLHLPFTVRLRQVRDASSEVETLFFAVCPTGERESVGFLQIARNYRLPAAEEAHRRELTMTVQEQDRRIVERQRPEQVPFDLAAELHIKGPDSAAVAYRRAMAELGVVVDS